MREWITTAARVGLHVPFVFATVEMTVGAKVAEVELATTKQ